MKLKLGFFRHGSLVIATSSLLFNGLYICVPKVFLSLYFFSLSLCTKPAMSHFPATVSFVRLPIFSSIFPWAPPPPFPTAREDKIIVWKGVHVTPAARMEIERVIRKGREEQRKKELSSEEVIKLCLSIGLTRAGLMNSALCGDVYTRVWDYYW